MSAGIAVKHSEFNPSANNPVHFLQIWIFLQSEGLTLSYEEKSLSLAASEGQLKFVGSPDGKDGSVKIH